MLPQDKGFFVNNILPWFLNCPEVSECLACFWNNGTNIYILVFLHSFMEDIRFIVSFLLSAAYCLFLLIPFLISVGTYRYTIIFILYWQRM